MALVQAFIPSGFSLETKRLFIEETKKALCDVFDIPLMGVSVWVSEFEPENMCEHAAKKRVLYVYTTVGKSVEEKNQIVEKFDQVCAKAFGDKKGDSFVIFKEHTLENLGARGKLRSLDTNFHAPKKMSEGK